VYQEYPAFIAAQRSMNAVMANDKTAWLALFADDCCVEDPVGKTPMDPEGKGVRGKAALSTFWDLYAGSGNVVIERKHSYGTVDEVANTIRITLGEDVVVDAVATYRVNEKGLIVAMRVFWDYDSQARFFS